MRKQTHIQQQRQEMKLTKDSVLALTGVSGIEYAEYQYMCGLKYLSAATGDDKIAAEEISASKVFWNWWKLKWAEREEPFCSFDMLQIRPDYRANIWRQLHNPLLLANGAYESGKAMEDSFAQMIGNIIKLTRKKQSNEI